MVRVLRFSVIAILCAVPAPALAQDAIWAPYGFAPAPPCKGYNKAKMIKVVEIFAGADAKGMLPYAVFGLIPTDMKP